MIRQDFLKLEDTANIDTKGINIYNLYSIDWNEFEFKNEFVNQAIDQQQVNKFYNLTNDFYGDLLNEDVIYFINGIPDPTELKPAQNVKLPSQQDIDDFLLQFEDNN